MKLPYLLFPKINDKIQAPIFSQIKNLKILLILKVLTQLFFGKNFKIVSHNFD